MRRVLSTFENEMLALEHAAKLIICSFSCSFKNALFNVVYSIFRCPVMWFLGRNNILLMNPKASNHVSPLYFCFLLSTSSSAAAERTNHWHIGRLAHWHILFPPTQQTTINLVIHLGNSLRQESFSVFKSSLDEFFA